MNQSQTSGSFLPLQKTFGLRWTVGATKSILLNIYRICSEKPKNSRKCFSIALTLLQLRIAQGPKVYWGKGNMKERRTQENMYVFLMLFNRLEVAFPFAQLSLKYVPLGQKFDLNCRIDLFANYFL